MASQLVTLLRTWLIMSNSSSAIPNSKRSRLTILGKTAVNVGAQKLNYQLKKTFQSEQRAELLKHEMDEKVAKEIFSALSKMKGLAIKFAQFLSLENHSFLPPAFQNELAKAHYKVTPINQALIRKIIHAELGDYPEQLFDSFDLKPIAAASIGQVHRATLKSGELVVIKVQYPGIDQSIMADLSLLKILIKSVPMLKNIRDNKIIEDIIAELEFMLPQEVDYFLEFQNGEYFRSIIDTDVFFVPKYYAEFSTKHVLCMDYVEGLHLPDWLETEPDQALKNQYAQTIFDFQLNCLLDYKMIHADPNFGNFFIMNDGRVGLVDFGCVRKIESDFAQFLPVILRAYRDQLWQTAWDTYGQLGMTAKGSNYPQELEALGEWISRPYCCDVFDFKENAHYLDETPAQFDVLNHFKSMHPNYVFFTRWHMGLYRMAMTMDASMSMSAMLL